MAVWFQVSTTQIAVVRSSRSHSLTERIQVAAISHLLQIHLRCNYRQVSAWAEPVLSICWLNRTAWSRSANPQIKLTLSPSVKSCRKISKSSKTLICFQAKRRNKNSSHFWTQIRKLIRNLDPSAVRTMSLQCQKPQMRSHRVLINKPRSIRTSDWLRQCCSNKWWKLNSARVLSNLNASSQRCTWQRMVRDQEA